MSYESLEASIEDASPIYLYQFAQGATVWRFTNDAQDVTQGGYTWTSSPISHSGINQTGEVERDGVRLTLPIGDPFGSQFIGYPPEFVTSFTLYRGHRDSADFFVWWKGRISTSRVQGVELELECESVFTSLKQTGLQARSQKPCRHALYHGGCRLDRADFATAAEVLTVSGVDVTLASAPADLTGGMLETVSTGELRMIVQQAGADLVLSRPLSTLIAEAAAPSGWGNNWGNLYGGHYVRVYPGCNRTPERCAEFANSDNPSGTNIENYGGFQYKPSKNPFSGTSIV